MIEIPSDCPIRVDDLKWAFAGLRPYEQHTGKVWPGRLVSSDDTRMANRFVRRGHMFRSMTAVALSGAPRRRIGADGEKAADERIREERRARGTMLQALRHAGVRTRTPDVRVQREPFQRRGARAELFAEGSRFSKHMLWHVKLRFHKSISGPLVIGDGRFVGLGLMEPVAHRVDVFALNLNGGHRVGPEDRPVIVRHLRRALMALARDNAGRVDRLFSGHETDGRSDSAGHHAHIFLAADGGAEDDGSLRRLIVAAPWAVDRRAKPKHGDPRLFDSVTRQLRELRAGRLGRFDHLMVEPVEDGDPLIGPAKLWTDRTPYVATRNLKKRDDPSAAVKADVARECRRRGLPTPADIDLLGFRAGPRGGRPAARLRLRFSVAVRGPLLLGRDSHSGGGLFHAAPAKARP